MPSWPSHVAYALDKLLCPSPYDRERVAEFTQRWGSAAPEACAHALGGDDPRDRLFALFAVACARPPDAATLLVPFLTSAEPLERWASAISLGNLRDARAAPALYRMLTEYLPPHEQRRPNGRPEYYFDAWRLAIPKILGSWGDTAAVPPLRAALLGTLHIRQARAARTDDIPKPTTGSSAGRENLTRYLDALVYALGRLEAYGSLAGVPADAGELGRWRVHLVMGSLHGRYALDVVVRWSDVPELERKVARLLAMRFGLGQDEQEAAMRLYEREKLSGLAPRYHAELLMKSQGMPY